MSLRACPSRAPRNLCATPPRIRCDSGDALRIVERILTRGGRSAGFALTLIDPNRARAVASGGSGERLVGVVALTLADALPLSALAGLEPLDRLAGGPVVAALLQVRVAGVGPERALGVDDAVALTVLLDAGDGLPPRPLPLDGGGRLPKLAQPAGPLQLDRSHVYPAAPCLLARARPVAGEQVGVPLPPGLVLLLGAAGLAFPVGGTVGPLPRQLSRSLGEGEAVAGLGQLAAAQQPPRALAQLGQPPTGRLLPGAGVGQPLLRVLALVGGVGDQPAAVGRSIAEELGGPAAFGAQLPLAHTAQVQRRRGAHVHRQPLAAVAAPDGSKPLIEAARLDLGDVQLQLHRARL